MNPQAFVALAKSLAAGSGEAEWRSSVSRAYYGAFHVARQLIELLEVSLPKGASAHEKLTYCLQHSGDADLAAAGRKLNSLREIRNAADYRLDDNRFENLLFAALQCAIAEEVVAVVQRAEHDTTAIRPLVREYAGSVLHLALRGSD